MWRAFARGCKRVSLSSGGDNNQFLYKDDAHVSRAAFTTGVNTSPDDNSSGRIFGELQAS